MGILILGGNGFLGKRVKAECQHLEINHSSLNREDWADIANQFQEYIYKKNFKSIIFCAGYSKRFDSEEIDNINELEVLAKCLHLRNCRVIYLSSSLVYGKQKKADYSNLKENLICRPTGEYGMYKRILEKIVLSSNPNNCVIRLTSCIGKEKKTGLMKTIEEKLSQSKLINMAYADSKRDYIHVKLASKVIVQLTLSNKSNGIFNIGSGKGITVKDIVKKVSKHKNKKIEGISFGDNMNEDPVIHVINLEKTRKLINDDLYLRLINTDHIKEYLEETIITK